HGQLSAPANTWNAAEVIEVSFGRSGNGRLGVDRSVGAQNGDHLESHGTRLRRRQSPAGWVAPFPDQPRGIWSNLLRHRHSDDGRKIARPAFWIVILVVLVVGNRKKAAAGGRRPRHCNYSRRGRPSGAMGVCYLSAGVRRALARRR